MTKRFQASLSLVGPLGAAAPIVSGFAIFALGFWLRHLPASPSAHLFEQLQFTCGIIALTFAGTAFVRFQGTRDRLPLILAASFLIIGITLASSSLGVSNPPPTDPGELLRDPLTWVAGRTLLAILLLAAVLVERHYALSHRPLRDIATAMALVVLLTGLLSASHHYLPVDLVVFPGGLIPRPGNLVPAAFFLLATLVYHRRLQSSASAFDWSLYLAAAINFWCSIAAAESARRLDVTFALAAVLQFAGYVVLLGGTLLDITSLFRSIRRLAASDSVTGLANYRSLIDSLEFEIQRTDRTGRPFALLLFDLDGLKKINDRYGHQAGTRALCRAADVLRSQSRAIDTAARHGGDEFALVLPETGGEGAQEVMNRVCATVASDGKLPPVSVSAGYAIHPRDGSTIESLMNAADRNLYAMKEQHKKNPRLTRQAAV